VDLNKAALNICMHFLSKYSFSTPLGIKEHTRRSYANECLIFIENQTIFQISHTILHSYQQWMTVSCSTSSSTFGIINVHSDTYVSISHYFNLHPSDDLWCGAHFHMPISICMFSLWDVC
jgi:hypothetical protein